MLNYHVFFYKIMIIIFYLFLYYFCQYQYGGLLLILLIIYVILINYAFYKYLKYFIRVINHIIDLFIILIIINYMINFIISNFIPFLINRNICLFFTIRNMIILMCLIILTILNQGENVENVVNVVNGEDWIICQVKIIVVFVFVRFYKLYDFGFYYYYVVDDDGKQVNQLMEDVEVIMKINLMHHQANQINH